VPPEVRVEEALEVDVEEVEVVGRVIEVVLEDVEVVVVLLAVSHLHLLLIKPEHIFFDPILIICRRWSRCTARSWWSSYARR